MEQISQEEADKLIELDKYEIEKIIKDGGKITDTIIREKDKVTTIRKIEPVNGKATSSTIVTGITLEESSITYSFIE